MTTLPLRPGRGGFLRPFGCGWFIREFLMGRAPEGSLTIDPEIGAYQEDLARVLNTKQASIARLESGSPLPSLSMVKEVADALDAELEIKLQPKHYSAGDALAVHSR